MEDEIFNSMALPLLNGISPFLILKALISSTDIAAKSAKSLSTGIISFSQALSIETLSLRENIPFLVLLRQTRWAPQPSFLPISKARLLTYVPLEHVTPTVVNGNVISSTCKKGTYVR